MAPLPLDVRFWSKVDQLTSPEGCWPWLGHRMPRGYGQVRVGTTHWLAHRVAYTLTFGPIPKGMVLDHLCRNTWCVNPDHLEVVTQRENLRRSREVNPHP